MSTSALWAITDRLHGKDRPALRMTEALRRKCCSVLQCVAVCCSVLQCVAVCCSVLQCVAVCCSVLQCVAVCRSALRMTQALRRKCRTVLHCTTLCCAVSCRITHDSGAVS